MESFIKLFSSNTNINTQVSDQTIKKIYVNNNDFNGYGIVIDKYILTLYHVIKDSTNITVDNLSYRLLLTLDEYDIAILVRKSSNLFDFINYFNEFNDDNIIKMSDIEDFTGLQFKLDNINITFNEIIHSHIRTNLLPSIPVYSFDIIHDIDYSGYSGHPIKYKDKYVGMLIMQKNSSKNLIVLPFDIINRIIKSYYMNDMKFYHLPVVLNDNIIINHGFRTLMPNDIIVSINNIELIDNTVYDEDLGVRLVYDTYLLLNYYHTIHIVYMRLFKSRKKVYNTVIKLKELNYSNLMLNYKDYNNSIKINSIEFSELSEELLINSFNNKINIPAIDYNNIYNKYKLIYLKNISNPKLLKMLADNNINIDKNIYILSKISGKKIKCIKDINNFTKNVELTIELIDSNNNNIKIKIC